MVDSLSKVNGPCAHLDRNRSSTLEHGCVPCDMFTFLQRRSLKFGNDRMESRVGWKVELLVCDSVQHRTRSLNIIQRLT